MITRIISDSVAHIVPELHECPACGAEARTGNGSCIGCLLHAAIEGETEPELADCDDIEVRDTDWRLGNYQILEEIGRGGMGVIYRARQRHSKRIIALKRVLSYHGDSRETLERFRREAEAAASLDHPNILPIHEVGEADGLPFFTMKYATGGSLQQAAPLLSAEPRECIRLLAKVARAVACAHHAGILHRDLKPGNILLDAHGEPMVTDFGLAKWIDATSDLTRSLAIYGTPGFIAPEQAEGGRDELTPAADIYSLGAVLFDLLTGRPPFLGEHAIAVIRQAADKPAPKLRSILPKADRDLETICAKCLEREARLRYRTAADLAEDLERWLEGRPIVARPVSLPVRTWRLSRRNPRLAGTLASCLVLAGALSGFVIESRIAQGTAAAALHSIAVAPLLDLDHAREDGAGAAELAAALQRELSRIGPARVALKGDGSGGTRALLWGTTRMQDGKRRLSLRLLNSANQKLLSRRMLEWPGSAEVAAKMLASDLYHQLDASKLEGKDRLEEDPGWQNQDTHELLVAGKAVYERRTLADHERATELFQKVTEAQPRSAYAFSYLAEVQSGSGFLTGDPRYFVAANAAAEKALALAPDWVKPHTALATVRLRAGKPRESLEEVIKAWELTDTDSPSLANRAADIFRKLGRPDRAVVWYRLGLGKESRPGWNEFSVGDCLVDLGSDDEAAAAYHRSSSLFPELPEGWMGLCRIALLQRDFTTARRIASEKWENYRDFAYSQDMASQVEFFSRIFPQRKSITPS